MEYIPETQSRTTADLDIDPETGVPRRKTQTGTPVVLPRCARLRANIVERKWTPEDHRDACQLPSCPACGGHHRRRWSDTHLLKGDVIGDHLLAVVVEFEKQVLPVGADQLGRYCLRTTIADQLSVIEELGTAFENGEFGEVAGWLYANHFSFHPPRRIGHHLHLAVLCGFVPEEKVLGQLRAFGRGTFTVKKDKRKKSHLKGFVRYLRHPPFPTSKKSKKSKKPQKPKANFTPKALEWVGDALVRPWQMDRWTGDTKQSLCLEQVGGPALSAYGFQCVRARARWKVLGDQLGIKQHASDPDREHATYLCDELVEIHHCVRCLVCSTVHPGPTEPQHTYSCAKKGCSGTWQDEPVFDYRRRGAMMRWLALKEASASPETKDPAPEQGDISQQVSHHSDHQSNKFKTLCREPDGEITVHRGDAGRKEKPPLLKRISGVG